MGEGAHPTHMAAGRAKDIWCWQEHLAWGTWWQWQPQLCWGPAMVGVSLWPLPALAHPSLFMPPQGRFCHHRGVPRAQAEPWGGMAWDVLPGVCHRGEVVLLSDLSECWCNSWLLRYNFVLFVGWLCMLTVGLNRFAFKISRSAS